ncbi:MAG: sigma-70 family RNA polymerase sigma factor [Anaerolineales bacterium]|nr:sigma-70 family RNA polymerase sigma factor [Anaerolineales bacterium]
MKQEETFSIDALRSGDREAFAAMVDEYSPKLYRLALRMLGDPQEAEDVLQDSLLKAYHAIDKFEGRSKVGTWLYRITSNEALMRLRKKQPALVSVDEPIQLDKGDMVPRQLEDWCCLPEDEFMTAEAMVQLDQAMEELSPALKAAFILRDLQGLSTEEAAETLEISESALKTRLSRARLQLRESLSIYFGDRVKEFMHG